MRFADFMVEQQIAERVEQHRPREPVHWRVEQPRARSSSGKMPPRIAEFEMLVHAIEGEERVIFRTPVEPPKHSRELLEVLGAVIVIDPSAPPIHFSK